ncbi:MAG: EthD family reductase [Thermomicrobiales bacterium]
MGAKMVVMYNRPTDPAAFDAYYAETHTPIAKTIPRMRSLVVSTGAIVAPDGSASPYHQIAELIFDSMADLQAAMSSPAGRTTAGDLRNFAGAGVTLLVYETREA